MNKKLTPSTAGFSLVELMVAMLLSLLLIAAVVTVYLSSSRTNRVNKGLISVQNDTQLAFQVLKEDIARAGWANNDSIGYTLTSPLTSNYSSNEGGESSDTLVIQYEACDLQSPNINNCKADGSDAKDCNGDDVSGGSIISNSYSVNSDNELICNGQVLIENVDSFQVLYGQVSAAGLQYVTADKITDRSKIQSIRFGILAHSANNTADNLTSKSVQLLDKTLLVNDKKMRLKLESTVVVLNKPIPFDTGI